MAKSSSEPVHWSSGSRNHPTGRADEIQYVDGRDAEIFEMEDKHANAVKRKYIGTDADQRDMAELGKTQELRRNFRFLSILGLGSTLIASWEVLITTIPVVYPAGGTAGAIWGYVASFIGMAFVYLSLAEMLSMAPTSGGQYHWVSEFAPQSAQKFLSYIVGWLCVLGWQAVLAGTTFFAVTLLQGAIAVNHPDSYVPAPFHATLLIIAVAAFSVFFNTVLAKRLPLIESLLLVLHFFGFFAIIIPLWVLSPIAPAESVFTEFRNDGEWNSFGTATLVGLAGTLPAVVGFDCVVHLSEEVRDAGLTMPRALNASFWFNAIFGFAMVVTIAFTIGDLDSVLATPTGTPAVQWFLNSTASVAGTTVMTIVVFITLVAAVIGEVAAASRQLWSFARDNGVPGHRWVSHITHGSNIPLNAVMISLAITSALALVNLGSVTALNAIISLALVALLNSYMICIGCVALRRLQGKSLPKRRWSLGRLGLPINVAAILFLMPLLVFSCFPPTSSPTAVDMNYGVVMYGGVIVLALVYYAVHGRKVYVSPVALVAHEYED